MLNIKRYWRNYCSINEEEDCKKFFERNIKLENRRYLIVGIISMAILYLLCLINIVRV